MQKPKKWGNFNVRQTNAYLPAHLQVQIRAAEQYAAFPFARHLHQQCLVDVDIARLKSVCRSGYIQLPRTICDSV